MLVISLTDPADVVPLCEFLRRVQVQVIEVDSTTIWAAVPGAQSDLHERRELDGYVVTWNALYPGRRATLLE